MYLMCSNPGDSYLTKNKSYKIYDIDIKTGFVKTKDDYGQIVFVDERTFKQGSYDKLDIDVNVSTNSIVIDYNILDAELPQTKSLCKFLNVKCPIDFYIDEEVHLIAPNKDYFNINNNREAIAKAFEIRSSIDRINYALSNTKIKERKIKIYGVEFEPEGVLCYFKSDEELEFGQAVYVYSENENIYYGIIKDIVEENSSKAHKRNLCRSL